MTTSTAGKLLLMTFFCLAHVADRSRWACPCNAVALDVVRVAGVNAGKSYELPADLLAVAAIDRITEETLHHRVEQRAEEDCAGQRTEIHLPLFGQHKQLVLLLRGQIGESDAVGLARGLVELGESQPKHLCRRERQLIALLRCPGHERRVTIQVSTVAPCTGELEIDEQGDGGLPGGGPHIVGGNDSGDRSFSRAGLVTVEEAPRVFDGGRVRRHGGPVCGRRGGYPSRRAEAQRRCADHRGDLPEKNASVMDYAVGHDRRPDEGRKLSLLSAAVSAAGLRPPTCALRRRARSLNRARFSARTLADR